MVSIVTNVPGWIGGQLLESDRGSAHRTIVGTWQTRADWQRWHKDPAFTKTRAELDELTAAPEEHTWYQVLVDARSV